MSNEPETEVVCDGDVCRIVRKKSQKKDSENSPKRVQYKNDAVPSSPPEEEVKVDEDAGVHPKMIKFLGNKLKTKTGEVNTVDALKDCDVVGFYFSAHWCPPCRGFTPRLAEFYKKMKAAGKKFEIVFLSSDKNQEAFDDYYKESHPWLAVPYSQRKIKNKTSGKMKVQGIPTLVFVDPKTGKVTNTEGRNVVGDDDAEKKYPWTSPPKPSIKDLLKEAKIMTKGAETTYEDLMKANNYLVLYFSAHWCPPCRGFTPKFAAWYKKNHPKLEGTDKSFDVLFVSSDQDEGAFQSYYKEHPWKALPYANRDLKASLSKALDVGGIPSVIVIDKDGNVVTTKARGGVMSDEDAKEFPWPAKPIIDFTDDPNDINSFTSLILFLDVIEEQKHEGLLSMLEELSKERKAKCTKEEEDLDMRFFYIKKDGAMPKRLRQIFKVKDDDKKQVKAMICSIPEESYLHIREDVSKASLTALLDKLDKEEVDLTSMN